MDKTDFKAFCAALGGLYALLGGKSDEGENQRTCALRAANLIEICVRSQMPDAYKHGFLSEEPNANTEYLLQLFYDDLKQSGSTELDFDRATLLQMYELTQLYQLRRKHKKFYETASDKEIINKIKNAANFQK